MSNLKAALYYREKLNYSVIPVGPNKKPLVEWKEYQEILPSPGEIREWWLKYPEANIGVVTGKVSNIVVVDIDSDDGMSAAHVLDDFKSCSNPGATIRPSKMQLNREFAPSRLAPWYW